MKLLLDTTVVIDALRRRHNRPAWLISLLNDGYRFAVSASTVAEVYAGMRLGEELKTATLLETLDILPVTQSIAYRAGTLKAGYARKGVTLTLVDMFIAATAIDHGLPLVTDNLKHFNLPELTLHPLPSNT